jgi:hypothetical protein
VIYLKSVLAGLVGAVIVEVLIVAVMTGYAAILAVIFGYYWNFSLPLYMANVGWLVAAVSFLAGFGWKFRRLSATR